MNENPEVNNDGSFLVRARRVDMDEGEFLRQIVLQNHLLVRDVRGMIFELADVAVEFFRFQRNNEMYPALLRVKSRNNGRYEILNIVRQPTRLEPDKMQDERKQDRKKGA